MDYKLKIAVILFVAAIIITLVMVYMYTDVFEFTDKVNKMSDTVPDETPDVNPPGENTGIQPSDPSPEEDAPLPVAPVTITPQPTKPDSPIDEIKESDLPTVTYVPPPNKTAGLIFHTLLDGQYFALRDFEGRDQVFQKQNRPRPAKHYRNGKVIYSGNIKMWRMDKLDDINEPFYQGRRDPFSGANPPKNTFKVGDVIVWD